MVAGSIEIIYASQSLLLLPDHGIYWPSQQALIIADVHLGKGAAFRVAGVPVPSGSSGKDLSRLDRLIELVSPARLIVLGDLVHAHRSHQAELFDAVSHWRRQHPSLTVTLVRGNHDRSSGRLPVEWGIEEVEEPYDDLPIRLAHLPKPCGGKATLCGHVHPVVAIRDFDRSVVRVPCFVFDDAGSCAILPSFGSFTGGANIARKENQRIFITSGKTVTMLRDASEAR